MAKIELKQLPTSMSRVWSILRPYRGMLLAGLLLIIINRACVLVIPVSTYFLIHNVIGETTGKHDPRMLPWIVIAVLAATAIQALAAFTVTQLLSKAAWRIITDLRIQVQKHIGKLPVAYYDANRTGTLVSRIMTDVEGVRNLVGAGLIDFAGGLLTALFALIMLLVLSPKITGVAMVFMGCFCLILRKVFRFIRPIAKERGSITAEVTGRLTESLGGVRVVKIYRAEDRESAVFSAGVHRLLDNVLRAITTTSYTTMASTGMIGVIAAVVIYSGGRQMLGHSLTVAGYVTYTMLLAYMVQPMVQVVSIGTQITEAIAGLDRTHEVLSEVPEEADPNRAVTLPERAIAGDIRFENVSFSYVEDKPVLRNISFAAAPGTVTALVGSSGSGKSTMIGLICGFHAPASGRILVDGTDLGSVVLSSYRSQLGVVLQESFLFDGTIRDNIAFSRPDATEEEVMNAVRIARVDEFADRFPEGLETIVGERGIKLSGGQRQRISIARAIVADPRVLVLDEATSSLDSESEALIQQGLDYLMRSRTTFVIAHRLSTIRRADQILVIESGEIVERGSHVELLCAQGRYNDLYTRQHAIESNLFLAPGEGDVVPEAEKDGDASLEVSLPSSRV
ncbi:ABC transporter ATP-binding protein [Silvibacterium acidisoli]|uniref:ABC transporter ATP-binding protein n=1 Tax=Acidobacteriaceae bacterium ZG23-2 TaxID=2883246 RepID=UPI00406C0044